MGRTYDALADAEKEFAKFLQNSFKQPIDIPYTKHFYSSFKKVNKKNIYNKIKFNLLNRNFKVVVKTILFISVSNKTNSYDHAINFAASLTQGSNLRVLLVDFSLWTLTPQKVFETNDAYAFADLFGNVGKKSSKIMKIGPNNLFLIRLGGANVEPIRLFESKTFKHFLKDMKKQFNFIVLNAPQIEIFSDFRSLCLNSDGVVLVLNKGKAARKIAAGSSKNHIELSRGKLLGVIINKETRYHKWLFWGTVSIILTTIVSSYF